MTSPTIDQPSQTTTPTVPARVGVLGGGRMGAGIAHAFLTNGAEVVVVERDEPSARAAGNRVTRDIEKSLAREAIPGELADWTSQLTVSTEHAAFTGCDLVVEAVPEDWGLKCDSLRSIERHTGEQTWIASNTSSLSIDGLADELARPDRFIGLHFFNPVPASKLVEVVIGARTSPQLEQAALGWVSAIGKTPVVVHDAPGFASSRLGVAIALEAIRMVEEGVAAPRDIDNAMVLGYKFPVGPLELTDIVGLDVRLGIAEYLESRLGPRFAPPQLMREMVARGELGRKTGKGFYTYTD
ncbi:3-hydroxyacyl-CoA dehydrogenase family protein [Raineyella sp.]|uniref:3-hydroxybutyryl-CoA dehydrogenase n=1 Tax=bioreactor metagenome TaxID=1076179 RepID=A0A644XYS2_9ZZZZ|nr:3-hydroxyacyl-CoA dehydrogenase family protein [Raineyella sp.]MEA5153681.1 3-hydroxyacyl-CoA dehydrogenase family protein [Raineyella sp.]